MIVRTINTGLTSIRIKQMMEQQKITPKNVKEALNIRVQAVYKWCNPKYKIMPSRTHIVMLAYMCKCRIDDLLVCEDGIFEENGEFIRTVPLESYDLYRGSINVWGTERENLSTDQVIANLQQSGIVIDTVATSERLRTMLKTRGMDNNCLQEILQFDCVQSIYHWFDEKNPTIPTLDHFALIAGICDCTIDDLLVCRVSQLPTT